MDQPLSLLQIGFLVVYAVAMTAGQLLFKLAALKEGVAGSLLERSLALAHNSYFGAALALYAGLTVLWVWILTFTPLSRAYGFVALAFVLTPLAGGFLFAEPIPARVVIGVGFVVIGLLCIAS